MPYVQSSTQAPALIPETASDKAAAYIRALIFSGELRPGDRLPAERDLANRLGISRVTLRLGLKTLEGAGYLVTSRGAHGGSRVNRDEELLRIWNEWIRHHQDELEDIFEFRTNVETRIAWLAAERRTDEELAKVEAADALFRETPTSLFRWDVEFHDSLARAAHSRRLEEAMLAVRGELFLPVDYALHEHRAEDVHAFHKRIIAAVSERDSQRAADEMCEHIADTRTMIYRAVELSRNG